MFGLRAALLAVALCSLTSLAQAKDVSAQQVGVEYARENLEKAEAEHKGNLQRVAESEKRLAEAQKSLAESQKRLAEDRQNAEASKKKQAEANAKFIRAQELLDKAWKD